MNNEKPQFYKRLGAYIIDLLVVALLASAIASVFTDTSKSSAVLDKMKDIIEKYNAKEISIEEYQLEYRDLSYDYAVDSSNVTVIMLVVTIVYYVIMSYFCHGITLGKYLMKIRIVGANNQKLSIFNYLLRSLIVNNILSSIASIITINTLAKKDYFVVDEKVSGVFSLLLIVTLIMLMYRKDGRGLHDIIGNTKVVNIDYKEEPIEETKSEQVEENKNEEIEEAKVIEEKKEVSKKTEKAKKNPVQKGNKASSKKKVGK